MRVLVDTDVILDFILPRPSFFSDAKAIWQANTRGEFEGFISAVTPANVFYIVRKERGIDGAKAAIRDLLLSWQVCPVDGQVLETALSMDWTDFEDSIQHASAVHRQIDVMVTRNLRDYRQASLTVLSPMDFITRLSPPTS